MAIKVDGSIVANTLGYFAFKKRTQSGRKDFTRPPKKCPYLGLTKLLYFSIQACMKFKKIIFKF